MYRHLVASLANVAQSIIAQFVVVCQIISANHPIVSRNVSSILNVPQRKHVKMNGVKIRVRDRADSMLNVARSIMHQFVIVCKDIRGMLSPDVNHVSVTLDK